MLKKLSPKTVLLAILLLALLLRLVFLPFAKYENETARDIAVAKQIIDEKHLRLVGITGEVAETSTQQSFGPLYYYLIAFFLLIWSHPYAAIFTAVFMSMCALVLCYFLVRTYFGNTLALLTTALFAFNPWFFAFVSLNLMTPSFLVPLVLLFFFALFKIIVDHRDSYLILAGLAAALMLQIHLSSLIICILGALLLISLRPQALVSRSMLYGVGIAFLFFIPFLVFNTQHDSFSNIFGFLTHRYEASRLENIRDSVAIPFMLGTTYFGSYLLGSESLFPSSLSFFFLIFDVILVALLFFGIFIAAKIFFTAHHSRRERYIHLLLLLWFFFPILFSLLSGTNISPHYLLITYPTQFIFIALALKTLASQRFFPLSLTFSLTVFLFLFYTLSFFLFLSSHGGTDGIYGIPLHAKMDVMEYLQEHDINSVYTYRYVKGEYQLLADMLYPQISFKPLQTLQNAPKGYFLLDLYSRGNFAEQTLTSEERETLKNSPSVPLGKLLLVELE